jgi:hypothetical protein
LKAPDNTEDEE